MIISLTIVLTTVLIVYRKALLTPSFFFLAITYLNLITYLIISLIVSSSIDLPIFLEVDWHFSKVGKSDLESGVILYILLLSSLPIYSLVKTKNSLNTLERIRFNSNQAIPSFLSDRIEKLSVGSSNQMSKNAFILNILILIVLYLLLSIHIINIELSLFISNDDFSATRDPYQIGLNNPFLSFIHSSIKLLSIISAAFIGFYILKKQYLISILFTPIFFYCLIIMLGATSKWALLSILVLILFFSLNNRLKFFAYILVALFISCLISLILIRSLDEYGLFPLLNLIFGGWIFHTSDLFYTVLKLITSLFNGAIVFAVSHEMGVLSYPESFKILSFSPLPSFIDGFRSLIAYEHRAAFFKPFNSLSEAYHFGLFYLLFYMGSIIIILRKLDQYFISNNTAQKYIYLSPFYLSVLMMHLYPLRTSFKFALISYLIILVIMFMRKKNVS